MIDVTFESCSLPQLETWRSDVASLMIMSLASLHPGRILLVIESSISCSSPNALSQRYDTRADL